MAKKHGKKKLQWVDEYGVCVDEHTKERRKDMKRKGDRQDMKRKGDKTGHDEKRRQTGHKKAFLHCQ